MKIIKFNEKYAVDNFDVGEKRYELLTVNNHTQRESLVDADISLEDCLAQYDDIKNHHMHNYTPYIKETRILTDKEIDLLLSEKKYNL